MTYPLLVLTCVVVFGGGGNVRADEVNTRVYQSDIRWARNEVRAFWFETEGGYDLFHLTVSEMYTTCGVDLVLNTTGKMSRTSLKPQTFSFQGDPAIVDGKRVVFIAYLLGWRNCSDTVFSVAKFTFTADRHAVSVERLGQPAVRKLQAGKIEEPLWTTLNEYKGEQYVWLGPSMSAYGYPVPMLFGGTEFWKGREFIELPSFETADFLVYVPGLAYSGPKIKDGYPFPLRSLLRYSGRDAAWVVWDFSLNGPVHSPFGDCDNCYKEASAVISADVPGMVLKVRPI